MKVYLLHSQILRNLPLSATMPIKDVMLSLNRTIIIICFLTACSFDLSAQTTPTCGASCTAPITYTGNITLSTQADLNNFISGSCKYTHVVGNLIIDGNGNAGTGTDGAGIDPITDLCNFSELESVIGNLIIRDFRVSGNPINLDDFAKLKTVGNDLTIGSNLNNDRNDQFADISLPNLESVSGILTCRNNTTATQISIPTTFNTTSFGVRIEDNDLLQSINIGVSSTTGDVIIHTNGNSVSSISLPALTSVGGFLNMNNPNLANNISGTATVNMPQLVSVSSYFNLDRAAKILISPELKEIGTNTTLSVANRSFIFERNGTVDLNLPELTYVSGDINIGNNSLLENINNNATFTAAVNEVSIINNSTLINLTLGIISSLNNVTIRNNGISVSSIVLDQLTLVDAHLLMDNGTSDNISSIANVSLTSLTEIKGRFEIVRGALSLNAPLLEIIGSGTFLANTNKSLTLNQNGVTNFDLSFPLLLNVVGHLTVTNNSSLSQCCVIPCQLVVGGTTTVNGNTGNCLDLATAQTNCQITVNITGDANACINGDVTLNGNPTGINPPFIHNWYITGGTGTATLNDNGDGTATFTGTVAGTIEIAYYATGNAGCISNTSTFTITVDLAPGLSACPSNQNIGTSTGGTDNCLGTLSFTHPSISGLVASCSPAVLQVDYDLGGGWVAVTPSASENVDFPVGTTIVNYRLLDVNTNIVATCTFDVDVFDDEYPEVTCPPATATINTNAGNSCEITIPNYVGDLNPTDNCTSSGSIIEAQDIPAGAYSVSGDGSTVVVNYTATDLATPANVTICTVTITVNDDDAPTVTCPPATATINTNAGNSCEITIPNYVGDLNPTDNCTSSGSIIEAQDVPAGAYSIAGDGSTVVVNYTATDLATPANVTICTVTITVNDDDAPTVTCPPATATINTNAGNSCEITIPNYVGDLNPTDNCTSSGSIIEAQDIPAGAYSVSGDGSTVVVNYTATDLATPANVTTCTVTITVNDDDAPTFTCPTPTLVLNTTGNSGCEVEIPNLVSLVIDEADNCGLALVNPVTQSIAAGVFSGVSDGNTIAVTVTVTDAASPANTTNCVVTFTVNDDDAPTFTCPTPTLVLNTTGNSGCEVEIPDLVSMVTDEADNCGLALVNPVTQSIAAGAYSGVSDGNTIPVTVTVTDAASPANSTNCVVTFTVNDDDAPTFTCPTPTLVLNTTGNSGCEVNIPDLVSMVTDEADNCGLATVPVTQSIAAGVFSGVSDGNTIAVTVTVTDAASPANTTNCVVTFTVNDDDAPTFTCPTPTLVLNTTGNSGCEVEIPNLVSLVIDEADNCGLALVNPVTQSIAAGVYSGVSDGNTIPVTVTVTDAASPANTTNCVVTFIVNDDDAPTVTCPTPTLVLNTTGNSGCEVIIPDLVSMVTDEADNCGLALVNPVTQSIAAGVYSGVSDGNTIPVTVTVTDAASPVNTTNCVVTFTVNDDDAPTFTCPTPTLVLNTTGNSGCEVVIPDLVSMVTDEADNCGLATVPVTQSIAAGAYSGVSDGNTIPVTVTVTDAASPANTTNCVVTFTVNDDDAPTFTCPPNITIYADASCAYDVNPTITGDVTNEADNCIVGQATYADVLSVDPCPGTKYIARTWSLVDDAGNAAANQVQIITILDNTPPVLTSTTYGFPDPSDNPDIDNYSCGSTFNYTTGTGICFTTKTITKPTWVDACGGTITRTHSANNSVVLTNFPGTPGHVQGNFPPGTTTVTFTGTDCSGNNTQCQVIITVTDDTDPTLTNCPVNQAVNTSLGLCNADVTTIVPITTDNCGVTSITHSATGATVFSGSGFLTTHSYNEGMTSVTYAVEDAAGNEAVCSFTVTVTDAEPPAITCPANISVNTDAGLCSAVVTYIAPVGTDNCSGATTAQSAGLSSGVAYPVGVTTNTFTITAANLQTASCSFTVTVTDTELPVITCPSNISVNTGAGVCTAVVNYTAPVGTDNCPGATTAQTGGLSSGATYPLGVTTNTFTVTAANLQTASCSFTITVTDNTPPSIVCPANQTVNLNASCSATMPAYSAVSTSDNCTGVISVVQSPAESTVYTAEGNQVVTLTATDANGNTNACTFNVYFDDVNAPVIAGCPSNQTVNTGVGNLTCTQTATWTAPSATDGCTAVSVVSTHSPGATFSLGTTTVSYTFSDGNGNSSVCSFTVTVIDNTVPVISCPSGVIVAADLTLCSAANVTYAATATDNCSTPVIVHSPASGSTFLVGVTTVTATATDLVGNSSSCSFTITVTDTQLPVITCPSNISVNTDAGQCSASVTYSTPVGTDNCAEAVTTQGTGLSSGSAFPIGTTTNTFVVTAANSQSASCSFTVTVTDAELPVITCPANISVNTDAGLCSTSVIYTTPVGTDNCAGAVTTQTTGFGSGSIFPIGIMTNTFVVTAANSQSASCSFTVTVTDAEPPAITCPSNISVNTDAGQCSAVVTYIAPVGTDNCSGATTAQTAGLGSGVAYPVGVTTNTFTVTAANLQTASCSFTVTVTDAELPVITCPSNISVNTGTGVCTAVVNYTTPVGTDNCPGATTAQTGGLASGATYPLGITTNTFTVTAANLQTVSCSFTVTVTDNTPPSIVCPANQTVNLNASCSATMPAYSAVSTSDNCTGVISVVQSPAASTVYTAEGNQVVTLTATDANGNTNACTFNVYFDDVNAPVIAGCPSNQTVNTGVGNLTCTQTATWTAPSATDGCTAVSVVSTHSPGATFTLGTTTVSYTFSDGNGNSSVCSFTVTVIDNTVPVISCPSGVIVAADLTLCSAANVTYAATATDNCSTPVIVHAPISGSTFAVGVTTVTATATDLVGNSSSCSFTVTVTDTQLPVITCPSNISVNTDTGLCSASVTYSTPVGTDNCAGAVTTQSTGLSSGSAFPIGTTTNTFVVTAANSQSASCSFTVTVTDAELPVITCPSNISVNTDAGLCSASVIYTTPVGTDNCAGAVTTQTTGFGSGSNFPIGITTNTFVVTAANSQSASCSFTVTVTDAEPPAITCPSNISVNTDAGQCSAVVTYIAPVGTDNCPGATTAQTAGLGSGVAYPVGVTTNTFTVTAANLQTASCSFTVTVTDAELPVITCPSNISVNTGTGVCTAVVNYTTPVGTDNCPGATTAQTGGLASGATYPLGVTTNTFTVTAANLQTASCSFTVTVTENTPPSIVCPANQTVNLNASCSATMPAYSAVSTSENCTGVISVVQSPASSTVYTAEGNQVVTLTATDANGNTNACTFNVYFDDVNAPVIVGCPSNQTVNTGVGNLTCTQTATWTAPSATDGCTAVSVVSTHSPGATFSLGTTTVSYTFSDGNGNSSVCSFTVTVIDNTVPVISCPSGVIVAADLDLCSAAGVSYAATATDNCSTPVIVHAPISGSTFAVGVTTVTATATDLVGNSSSCSFTVTVTDTQLPVITCPSNISVNTDTGLCSASVTYSTPVGTDNCAGAVTTQSTGLSSGSAFPIGTTTNTFVVTAANSQSASCSFTVTVTDAELPVITCPSNISVNTDAGLCSASVIYTTPVGTDNCAGAVTTQTTGFGSGSNFPIGITTNTFVVTAANSQSASCSFTVTVTDAEPPAITCPSNISVNTDAGQCSAVVTYIAPVGTDNCSGATTAQTAGLGSGVAYPVGVTTNTFTVTAANLQTASCSFTVTVTDAELPVITCPSNISVNTGTGVCTAVVNYTTPVGTDNCPGATTAQTGGLASGATYPLGVTTNTFTVTAANLQTASCSFTVTVTDNTPPSIVCPANQTVNLNTSCSATMPAYSAVSTSDNCTGVISVVQSPASSTVYTAEGNQVVTLTATDANGNTNACTFNVYFDDVNAPVIAGCPSNQTVNTGVGNLTCTQTATWTAPSATDGCTAVSVVSTHSPGATFTLGTTTVSYTFSDGNGNSSVCSFTVTVIDNTVPVISCPSGVIVAADLDLCSAAGVSYAATATDNCSTPIIVHAPISGSTFAVGVTTVTATATDLVGNSSSCSFTVTVTDTQLPVITCPTPITIPASAGVCETAVTYSATASDNCSVMGITYSPASGSIFSVGTTPVTATATDVNGNSNNCTFNVTVVDDEEPVITCPADITVPAASGTCTATVTFTATATDNCGVGGITYSPVSGSVFAIGTTNVTATATDIYGNDNDCTFDVTVLDTQAPVISGCPGVITVYTGAGDTDCSQNATWTEPTAIDNCMGPVLWATRSHAPGSLFGFGSTTVSYVFTDAYSNSTTCSFTVVVVDNTQPLITCPANQTVNLNASCSATMPAYSAVSTSDNCTGVISVVQSPAASTVYTAEGNQVVTLTTTDANGNTNACTFNVYFDDVNAPVIAGCPSNQTVNTGVGNLTCTQTATWTAPSATDGCTAVSVVSTHSPGATFTLGTTTVSYTFNDGNGNSSVCSFTVTVIDNTVPVISCPSGIILAADVGLCSRANVTYAATATDNCSTPVIVHAPISGSTFAVGVTTVTATATDLVGNSSSCSFTVTVTDTQLPVITCPTPITIPASAGVCETAVTYSATASDNCSVMGITYSPASGSIFSVGTTPVTATATDVNGNSNNCTFNVTVVDDEDPVITCPADITVPAASGTCTATVTFTATATDNCGVGGITYSPLSGSVFAIGTTNVTATATDIYGNDNDCTFDVTVLDTQAPVISGCPGVITVYTGAGDTDCSQNATWTEPTAIDNCMGPVLWATRSHAPGSLFGFGSTTVSYVFTDAYSNSSTCSFTVVVVDNTQPIITCPADQTVNLNASCSATMPAYSAVSTSDNCTGVISVVQSPAASTVYTAEGNQVVTLTATDANGNTNACTFNVYFDDVNAPVIAGCPSNQTVNTGVGNLTCTQTATWTAPSATDGCAAVSVVSTHSPGAIFALGTTTVSYTFSDGNGNSSVCSFTVTVIDNTVPVISCPSGIILAADMGLCSRANVTYAATATDNCSTPVIVHSPASGSTFLVGVTTVTATATDLVGNSSSCSFTVTVTDTQLPVITCPTPITIPASAGVCETAVTYSATASDNCSVMGITYSPASGSIFSVGTTPVTATATDVNGNSNNCTFNVTVVDDEDPVITCPADITVPAAFGYCSEEVSFAATATDNCGVSGITYNYLPGSSFGVGTIEVTATATDLYGNDSSCTFDVTVLDTQAPVISGCPGVITVYTGAGDTDCSQNAIWTEPTAIDNCMGPVLWATRSHAPGSLFGFGSTTVSYVFTDAYSNSSTCSFTVVVVDNTQPLITCPADQTVNLNASCSATMPAYSAVSTSDNCTGVISVVQSPAASTVYTAEGNQVVTLTATDANGNTNTCTFNVYFDDVNAPVIAGCPLNITVYTGAGNGTCTQTATWIPPSATDGCTAVSVVSTHSPGAIFALGTTTVSYTFSDGNGNSSVCSFTVTVIDNTVPVISGCPGAITVNTGIGNPVCSQTASWTEPTASDSCPGVVSLTSQSHSSGSVFGFGTTTVTYVFTDANSNNSTCSFTVTVLDNTPPVITCPPPQTVPLNATCLAALPAYSAATLTDNCSGSIGLAQFPVPSTIYTAEGNHTVVLTATDANGNTNSCNFNVFIDDVTSPFVFGCPTDITVSTGPGNTTCTQSATWTAPSANDACVGPIVPLVSHAPGTFFPVGVTTVSYTFNDGNSNTSVCSFTVTVLDNTPPVLVCPAAQFAETDDDGGYNCTTSIAGLQVTALDNCTATGLLNFTYSVSGATVIGTTNHTGSPLNLSSILFGLGSSTVTVTAADTNSPTPNVGIVCTFTVTVADNEDPQIVCAIPAASYDTDLGVCTYTVPNNGLNPTFTNDNCSIASVMNNFTGTSTLNGAVFPLGATTVVWTILDGSGNTTTCSYIVTVVDNQNPMIVCAIPASNYNTDTGVCTYTVIGTALDPVSTDDNCSVASVVNNYNGLSSLNGAVFPLGNSTVLWTVTDGSGRTATCNYTITVVDNENPVITCATPALSYNTDPNLCTYTVVGNMLNPVATSDNCSILFVTNDFNNTATLNGAVFPLGSTVVTWSITDGSLNGANCSYTVTVVDNQNPAITCATPAVSYPTDADECTYTVPDNSLNPVLTDDNCSVSSVVNDYNSSATLNGAVFPLGNSLVTWTVVDGSGNSSTCAYTVVVTDTQNPVLACPANQIIQTSSNGTGDCSSAYNIADPLNDNCTGATWGATFTGNVMGNPTDLAGIANGTDSGLIEFKLGTTTVTLNASDGSSNIATPCSFTVTVEDDEMPVAVCQSITIELDNLGQATILPEELDGGSTDNCSITFSASRTEFSCLHLGDNTVMLTVTDPDGNSDDCITTVTVEDNVNPAAICQDVTIYLDGDGNAYLTAADINNGSNDNCEFVMTISQDEFNCAELGNNIVTLTVTDSSNNEATCQAIVTVADDINPNAVCQDVYTQLGPGSTVTVTTGQVNNGSTDNCGTVNEVSLTPDTFMAEGAYLATLLINDGNGNESTCDATISVGPLATADDNTPICEGATLMLFSSGGVSYSWSGPLGFTSLAQNPVIPGATAAMSGIYTVTVTGALGFTATASTNVIVDVYPSGSLMGTMTTICVGNTIDITAFGGATYLWNGPNGFSSTNANIVIPNVTTAMSGLYVVTVTSLYGCSVMLTSNITVHPNPVVGISGTIDACSGQPITLTATGGATYIWSGPGGYTSSGATLLRPNANAGMEGVYTVTVTNTNGCTSTGDVYVTVGTTPTTTITGSTATCLGGTLSLTASGGVNYAWSGPGGYTANSATITRTGVTFGMGGNYIVTVTSANGCTASTSVTVTTNGGTASITGNTGFCTGSTITLTASGGTSYAWSGPGGFTAFTATMTRSGATTAMAGTYTVTVTGAGGCTATASHTITIGSTFTAGVSGTLTYCEGTTITLTATGGVSYLWSGPGGYSSAGAVLSRPSATPAMSGAYTVTVTNAGGCTATATRNVTVNPLPTANITGSNVICQGTTLTLTASGGTSYVWSGPGFSATTATINRTNATVAMSGTYTVTVTGTGGCKSTMSIAVTVNPKPVVSITGPGSVCNGSTLFLTATGGATYAWSGPGGFSYSGATMERSGMNSSAVGSYTVTVTSVAGCTSTATKYVSVLATPTVNVSGTLTYCAGANIGLTASGGSTYSWSGPGGFTASTASFIRVASTVAMSGVYTVTVTASNGCSNTASRTITVNPLPIASASSNSPVCAGTQITLFGSGGVAYQWQGPALYSSTLQNPVRNSATTSMGGTYNLTVTDSNGCKGTTSTVVLVLTCPGKTETMVSGVETLTAYPNPTGGMTTIEFSTYTDEQVQLKVFAADGREVSVLFDGKAEGGTSNQLSFDMNPLPSGIYYAVLRTANGETQQIKLMVVR